MEAWLAGGKRRLYTTSFLQEYTALQDMVNQMENNGGGRKRSCLSYGASLYFLNYDSCPMFPRDWLLIPLLHSPQMEDTPWPLPQLWLAECQGQGVFQRQSLASPGQDLETSVRVSAWLTSKVSQLQDANHK